MLVASRQSAGLPMYRSNTIHRGSTGDNRGVAVALLVSVWALVELRCNPGFFLVLSRLFLVLRLSLPVLPIDSRFIPEVFNILILSQWSRDCPWSFPVHAGCPRWSPGSSRQSPDHAQGLDRHHSETGPLERLIQLNTFLIRFKF
ncbi:hypothetical protein DPMN_152890 [Dreissena polymorpha]|uniref:Uncharacterized protein n=1 Tax=Dreissena polymorpha TaxID=45954 RepID=A0A9D4FHL6_DREPO|nr:hypothetical protein DPMN_152890 [Dreissena polymorpha]